MELTESNRQNILLLLILLSLICLCSSFLLFVCAVNIKATIDARISLLETYNSQTIPGLFLFVGLVNMLENGSCAFISTRLRTTENRERMMKALIPVLIGGIVLVILEVSSTIASLVHIGILDSEFGEGIVKAMKEYVKGEELKQEIDFVQSTYMCCGEMGYTDWFRHPWNDASNLVTSHTKYLQNDGLYYSDDSPYSCCDRRSPRPCIHHHVHDLLRHHNYDYKTETTLHHAGCRRVLSSVYSSILTNISVISLIAALLKIGIVLLLRLIHTSLSMAQERDDWEATTPAYIYFLREATDPEYEKLGDESQTENEDNGGGGGDGDGGETTDDTGGATTDDETDAEATTSGDDDADGGDGDDGDGDDTGDGDDEKDANENLGGSSRNNAKGDVNINYSPPHDFMQKLRKKGRDLLRSRIEAVNDSPLDQIPVVFRKNHVSYNAHGQNVCPFGEGRSVLVTRSRITPREEEVVLSRPETNRRVKHGDDGFDEDVNNTTFADSDISNFPTGTDYSKSQFCYDNGNNRNRSWNESGSSTCIGATTNRHKNMWDFMRADKKRGNLSYIDTLNPHLVDTFVNSSNYSECDETLSNKNVPRRHAFQNGERIGMPSTNSTHNNLQSYSARENTTSQDFKKRNNELGNIPSIDEINSSFINSFSNSRDYPVTAGPVSRKKNVSELLPLQNMKTKSTEISWDKWQPLSVGEAGPDKDVVQFPGHRGDKLVDISSASNEQVFTQKSIRDGNGASGYFGMPDNNKFTRQTIESECDSGTNKKPNVSRRLFSSKREETPHRPPPPVIICQTTLTNTSKPNITRPEPIFATNQRLESVIVDNEDRSDLISKGMSCRPRNDNTFSQQSSGHFFTGHATPMSRSDFSEYDLIPTIQRRGHDTTSGTISATTCPDYSAEEVSPEVAGINFPQTLSMDCTIDIDFPNSKYDTTQEATLYSVMDSSIITPSDRKPPNFYRETAKTPVPGNTSSSSEYLDDTITEETYTVTKPQLTHPLASKASSGRNNNHPQYHPYPRILPKQYAKDTAPLNHALVNQERKNHYRSSQRTNIFLASPISTNSLDISTSSTDSKIFPQTSTPIDQAPQRSTKSKPKDYDGQTKFAETTPQHAETNTRQLSHNHPQVKPKANMLEYNVPKEVENLIDIPEASFHEYYYAHKYGDASKTRSSALISPFN